MTTFNVEELFHKDANHICTMQIMTGLEDEGLLSDWKERLYEEIDKYKEEKEFDGWFVFDWHTELIDMPPKKYTRLLVALAFV